MQPLAKQAVFSPMPQGYLRSDVDALLAEVRQMAPGLVYVATDATMRGGRVIAILAKQTKRDRIELGYPTGGIPSGAVAKISVFLGISDGLAYRIADALRGLFALNPNGAWNFDSSEEGLEFVAGSHFTQTLASSLHELLPEITRISAGNFQQGTSHGHERTRTFLSFIAAPGNEVAAIDGAYIGKHIEAHAAPRGDHTHVNLNRSLIWANQLGADLEDMPFVLHDLHGLFIQARVQAVDLLTNQVAF